MKKIVLLALLFPFAVLAEDADYTLVLKDHRFQPEELIVPSGKKIKLKIENRDALAEEFESFAMNREKAVAGNGSATLFIGPLEAGRYPFIGEFYEETAHGVIIAK